MTQRRRGLLIGVCAAAGAGAAALAFELPGPAVWTAAVTALCAAWWVLEPIPIAATSLIPFAVFPLTGVLGHDKVANAYGHTLILLLMGGFMLATAIEKSGVHRRMALGMVRLAGGGGRRLVLGFMLASATCSMWISNAATVLMLLPVALAVLEDRRHQALAVPLLLGIAYAASVGGLATPIGTPPNVLFMGTYQQVTGSEVSFLRWMSIGLPATLILVPLIWLHLTRTLRVTDTPAIPGQGPWRPAERRVLVVFALTAAAWIFRTGPFGGWGALLGAGAVSDSTVALAAVVILFLVPDGDGGGLLDWPTARTIPWNLLLLFGGGIAISAAFQASGLSDAIGAVIGDMVGWNLILATAILCVTVSFLTEVTSNTAVTSMLMPLLAAAALSAAVEPMRIMVPAALSASCAFMLPVATAPNAIVAGTELVTTRDMARHGLVLNLGAAVAITIVCLTMI